MRGKDNVYGFLAVLNIELDEVRDCLLGRHPLPTMDEVFVKVLCKAYQCHGILGDSPSMHDALFIAAQNPTSNHASLQKKKGSMVRSL